MKLTQITKRKAGMTLLELTVVILVLLALISILFIGARAWKKGSDRAANILNIRNVQQAVRGHENMRGLNEGDALVSTTIFGTATTQGYLKEPKPPMSGIAYTYDAVVPPVGDLYLNAAYTAPATVGEYGPDSEEIKNW